MMPSITRVTRTGNQDIDGLLYNSKWATLSLTFSFPTDSSYYGNAYANNEPMRGFEPLNAFQKEAAKAAMTMYQSVSNIRFTEITESSGTHADLRFAESDVPGTASGYYPSTAPEAGDSWYNHSSNKYDSPIKGNYAYHAFLHEVGHTLGLEHAHDTQTFGAVSAAHDSMEYSVMSYRSYVGDDLVGYNNETFSYAQSLMMYDIAAIQHLYGANFIYNSSNTIYQWSPTSGRMTINGTAQETPGSNKIFMTVWDGGGVDTYDFTNYTTPLTINLQPGEWTVTAAAQLARLDASGAHIARGNIANALQYHGDSRSLIENAYGGTGNDTLYGNAANNDLRGSRGNDLVGAREGNDTVYGGIGNDTLYGAAGNDRIDGNDGRDTAGYHNPFTRYRIEERAAEIRVNGPEDTDRLFNIERLQFSDGAIDLDDNDWLIDPIYYMKNNPDVYAAQMRADIHYNRHGWHEGRDPDRYFDTDGYLKAYPDVARSGMNPLDHYRIYGWKEGRDPHPGFDSSEYLSHYRDVASIGMNPLEHYLAYGQYEGRSTYGDGMWDLAR